MGYFCACIALGADYRRFVGHEDEIRMGREMGARIEIAHGRKVWENERSYP